LKRVRMEMLNSCASTNGGTEMNTISDLVLSWMETYKRNTVKPATFDRLEISYRTMLNYPISQIRLFELRSEDIQDYVNALVKDGYALSTIKKQFTLLTAFLKHEFAQGAIKSPMYLTVKLPIEEKVAKPAKKVEVYSSMEQKRLLKVTEGLEFLAYGAIILMLEAGLRCGEAQCLTWDDILWDEKAVRISKTLVRLSSHRGDTFVQQSAKSKASNRTIPLSQKAMDVLERLADRAGNLSGYIFPSTNDDSIPMSYFTVKYYLKMACEKAGVKYKSAHALRHTFATNCYHRGCDVKILSKLLGHADVTITYNIYIHLYGNELEAMRKVIG
jgi:integrase